MNTNKLRGLYAITDSYLIPEDTFNDCIKRLLLGGASIIQYRDKSNDPDKRLTQARALRELCDSHGALLIINDDIELAIQTDADGVHLGKDDMSLTDARKKLGNKLIIGLSCYDQLESAIEAENQGADYVAFGAVYQSPTKPDATVITLDMLKHAKSQLSIPVCAIGGINGHNALPVVDTGVDMVAVISDLFAHDDIQARSEALSNLFM